MYRVTFTTASVEIRIALLLRLSEPEIPIEMGEQPRLQYPMLPPSVTATPRPQLSAFSGAHGANPEGASTLAS